MWLEILNFLHFVGLAFGLGGATIMAIISNKAEKHKEVALAMRQIGPSIVKFIWVGLILLIVSGIALPFYIKWQLNKNMLLVKHVLVFWIVIMGIILGVGSRKRNRLAPKENPSEEFLKTKRLVRFFSIINLILWYLITIFSVFI